MPRALESQPEILENPSKESLVRSWNNSKQILSSNSSLRLKEPKYKFPSSDPNPTQGLIQHSPKDLYFSLINMCYHRLHPDTYRQWCQVTERDVAYTEMSKDGILQSSYSLKNQRTLYKKLTKKNEVTVESNVLIPKASVTQPISSEIIDKIKNIDLSKSMYLLNRNDYIQLLNNALELNFSKQFNKLLNKLIILANLKEVINCQKIRSLHQKLIKIYKNSFLDTNRIIYRGSAYLFCDHDNLKLPWLTCILDINRDGKALVAPLN